MVDESTKVEPVRKAVTIEEKEGSVMIKVNPKIYPIAIIYQAADVFIDKNYVFLDGDPETEVLVTIKPKKKGANLGEVSGEFNNEVLNYAAYFVRAATNRDLRELLLKRAFFSTSADEHKENSFAEKMGEKEKVDIGFKVPIYSSETSNNFSSDAPRNKSFEDDKANEVDFDIKEIIKPWEEQKGKIQERSARKEKC